ncbi:hypothetical protein WJX72_000389 [[Myrmecia] bisecta]|uniref:Uncharacterized protein n=1 Tax=[Myrmecia] bisecta TaxID=41462 RepID=A0AAW1QNR2_9CHLO
MGRYDSGSVYAEALPDGRLLTIAPGVTPGGSNVHSAQLWDPISRKPLSPQKLISEKDAQARKAACKVGPKLQQLSETCYFNASLNGLLLGQLSQQMLLQRLVTYVGALPPPERIQFLREPLDMTHCKPQLMLADMFRVIFAMLCPNSPTPLTYDDMFVSSESDVPEAFVRGLDPTMGIHGHTLPTLEALVTMLFGQSAISRGYEDLMRDDILVVAEGSGLAPFFAYHPHPGFSLPREIQVVGENASPDTPPTPYVLDFGFVEPYHGHITAGVFCNGVPVVVDSNNMVYERDWLAPSEQPAPKGFYNYNEDDFILRRIPSYTKTELAVYVRKDIISTLAPACPAQYGGRSRLPLSTRPKRRNSRK